MASEKQISLHEIKEEMKDTMGSFYTVLEATTKRNTELELELKGLSKKFDELKRLQDIVAQRPERGAMYDGVKGRSEGMKAFASYVLKGARAKAEFKTNYVSDMWDVKSFPSEVKGVGGLVEDTTGQILVPEEVQAEIIRVLPTLVIMRGLCSKMTLNSNRIRYRTIDEVTMGWGKLETQNFPYTMVAPQASTQTPADHYQYVEDLYGLVKMGEDLLMDSDNNLETILADSFSRAIAAAEDAAFIAGTGHAASQPLGVFDSASGIDRVVAGQNGGVTVDDFLSLIYALDPRYRVNASFIVNNSTELVLRQLKDGHGAYLWQPTVQAGRPNTFLGYPIYNQVSVPTIPNAGTQRDVAAFGDFMAGYRILDHQSMGLTRLNELYAESGLVGFRMQRRVGGSPIRTAAMKVLRVPA